jgi:hypothetical protein
MTAYIMTRNYDGGVYAVVIDAQTHTTIAESNLYNREGWHTSIGEMTRYARTKGITITHIDGFLVKETA